MLHSFCTAFCCHCFFQSFHLLGPLMEFQPKTKPGSLPVFTSSSHRNLMIEKMSISQLVSVLRDDDYVMRADRIQEVLVAIETKHKAEMGALQEKIEMERLMRLQAEHELKEKVEQCQKSKRALETYQEMLKKAKERELRDEGIIEEFECENFRLMELTKNRFVDRDDAARLRIRVAELENKLEKIDASVSAPLDRNNGTHRSSAALSEHVSPLSKKAKTRKGVQTVKKTNKKIELTHILVQIIQELQGFTNFQRTLMKASVKELKRTDKRLEACQERWMLLLTQLDASSPE